MSVEIERKYLVDPEKLPPLSNGMPLEQGYLARNPWVRVRVGPEKAWFTVKTSGNLVRSEWEWEIPRKDGMEMMVLAKGKLTKERYHLYHAGKLWEVDRFTGAHDGLWLAEIELKAEDETFEEPPWLVREVTEDPRYSNAALAEMGRAP
jgi:CYTH domain-containing protein